MVPRDVVFVDELPHTDSGKIRKKSLLELDVDEKSGQPVHKVGPAMSNTVRKRRITVGLRVWPAFSEGASST